MGSQEESGQSGETRDLVRRGKTVFYDEAALLISDPEHSESEDRFLLIGTSSTLRELVVAHCYRQSDAVIRIISARKATSQERRQYRAKSL